jgi:hypothetical protein
LLLSLLVDKYLNVCICLARCWRDRVFFGSDGASEDEIDKYMSSKPGNGENRNDDEDDDEEENDIKKAVLANIEMYDSYEKAGAEEEGIVADLAGNETLTNLVKGSQVEISFINDEDKEHQTEELKTFGSDNDSFSGVSDRESEMDGETTNDDDESELSIGNNDKKTKERGSGESLASLVTGSQPKHAIPDKTGDCTPS